MSEPLHDNALGQLFRTARSYNGYLDRPVSEAQLRAIWDLLKVGPTSANGLPARIGADFSYQSKVFFSAVNAEPMAAGRHGEINLNAGFAQSSGVDMSLFVRNVGNKRYRADMNDLSSLGFYFPVYNEPRTYGLTLCYTM